MITRDFLKSVELFSGLAPADADALVSLAQEEVFQKGQAVFRERDAGGKLYLVISGVVEISKSSPGAAPMALARLSRGEMLGEIAAFDGGPRSATATAGVVAETHLASWEVAAFHRFLAARPQAGLLILTGLLSVETQAEFADRVKPYLDSLYRTALRMTGEGVSAEDLVQETFLKATANTPASSPRRTSRPGRSRRTSDPPGFRDRRRHAGHGVRRHAEADPDPDLRASCRAILGEAAAAPTVPVRRRPMSGTSIGSRSSRSP